MRNKELVSKKVEQVDNALTNLGSHISTGTSSRELKEFIVMIKEKLMDIQTLLNTESDSWN